MNNLVYLKHALVVQWKAQLPHKQLTPGRIPGQCIFCIPIFLIFSFLSEGYPYTVYKSFCVHLGCSSTRSCAALMHVHLQELRAASGRVRPQEPVLHLRVQPTRAFVLHLDVTLYVQEPVLHLCVSVYKSFCAAPRGVCLQEPMLLSTRALYCTWMCLSTSACLVTSPCCTCRCALCSLQKC